MLPAAKVEEKIEKAKKAKIWSETIATKDAEKIVALVLRDGKPDSVDPENDKLDVCDKDGKTIKRTVRELLVDKLKEKFEKEKEKERIWRETIGTKEANKIVKLVRDGGMPESFDFKRARLAVYEFGGKTRRKTVTAILIDRGYGYTFKYAEELMARGATLPVLACDRKTFKTTAEFFAYLVSNTGELYIMLRREPMIVKVQDEKGQTLLHHAVRAYCDVPSVRLLVESKEADFSIPDAEGNTVVHKALCDSRIKGVFYKTSRIIIEAALKKGFNFSLLNKKGFSLLHIAVANAYCCPMFGRRCNVGSLLKSLKEADVSFNIDVLAKGKDLKHAYTALYFAAINRFGLDVSALLDAGANPLLHPTGEPSVKEILVLSISELIDAKEKGLASAVRERERKCDVGEDFDERIEKVMKLIDKVIIYEEKVAATKPGGGKEGVNVGCTSCS